jgi:3-oxoacyl-[acyl-carrier protein] reductase
MSNEATTWIVTGASRGIGLATADHILAQGGRVSLVARGEGLEALADDRGDNCMACRADVSRPEDLAGVAEAVLGRWGRIDVLVNNAGLHRGGRVGRLKLDDWQAVLGVNLTGALNAIRAVEPHLVEGGAIVNVGAVVGFRGFPGDSAYAASKAGLSGLTRALAIELAPRGIRVNLVIPGLVLTEMTGGVSEKALEAMRQTIPLGRYGEAEDIARVIHWVGGSDYMTGAFVPVDGGLLSSFGVPGQ